MKKWHNMITPGIPDHEFIRGEVPMTKEEVRVVTLSKLELKEDDVVLDIGAGTGSLSIECARLLKKGKVLAVEKKQEGINLLKQNKEKFQADNMTIIQGVAPEVLDELEGYNKVIIGGSGNSIEEILKLLGERLDKDSKVVINTITVENTYRSLQALEQNGFSNIQLIQLNCAKSKKAGQYTMMFANNPINILWANKKM